MIRGALLLLRHAASKHKVRALLRARQEIWLEVGAGDKKGTNGWLTLDVSRNCDIFWDLRKGIPFPNASVAKIYSSHFLEHLSFKEGQRFLDECVRVLSPGGSFSVCVPNARLYIEAYLKGIDLEERQFFIYKPAFNHTTRMDYVNYTAYMDGHHKYMFDEENLVHLLKSKGLRNARLRKFDPSIDLSARDYESIYAEAER